MQGTRSYAIDAGYGQGVGVEDAFDARDNIMGGAKYIAENWNSIMEILIWRLQRTMQEAVM